MVRSAVVAGVALLCACGLLASHASAQVLAPDPPTVAQRQAATLLANEGARAYERGDFETAEQRFSRAYEIAGVPSLGLWHARCLAKLGRLVEAAARYRDVVTSDVSALPKAKQRVHQQAQADAVREQAQLDARIPRLIVRFDADLVVGPRTYVDGVEVALGQGQPQVEVRVDPGSHTVAAVVGGAGTQEVRETVVVAEGETKKVVLPHSAEGRSAASASAGDAGQEKSEQTQRALQEARVRQQEALARQQEVQRRIAELRLRAQQRADAARRDAEESFYWAQKRAVGLPVAIGFGSAGITLGVMGFGFKGKVVSDGVGTAMGIGGFALAGVAIVGGVFYMTVDTRSDGERAGRSGCTGHKLARGRQTEFGVGGRF